MKRLSSLLTVFLAISSLLLWSVDAAAALPDTTKPVTTITLTPGTANGTNGWYKIDVGVAVTATDNVGVTETRCVLDPVPAPASFDAIPAGCAYLGAGANVTTEGSHVIYAASRDAAGNKEAPKSKSFKLDKTPPIVTGGAPNRAANAYGWYTSAVTVVFDGTDATSGKASCSSVAYSGPDSATASVTGTCTDKAGNVSAPATSSPFKYDATGPTNVVLSVTAGTLGNNGWYVSDVTVHTSGADPVSGISSCTADQFLTSDTTSAGRTFSGSCLNGAGLRTYASALNIKLDKTPPSIWVGVTPDTIWPPNHQLVDINAQVEVSDARSGPAGFVLASVTSSQPDQGTGDGDTPGDIQGFDLGTADTNGQLRAERSGGSSRVYTLTYTGQDQAGNTATGSATVQVPNSAAAPRKPAIGQAADRVVALQRTDPGWEGTWYWYVGSTYNATNLTGATALGLLEAYRDTKDPAYLDAAKAAAGFAMAHLGSGATGTKHWIRMTAPDISLLHYLTQVTGDGSYATRATSEWANIKTYYPTAGAMDSYFRSINRRLGAWDLAAYMEAAYLSGDAAWAGQAAAILANTGDSFYYGTDNVYYAINLGGAVRALVSCGYAGAYPDAVAALLNSLAATISVDNIGGSVQDTAYGVMALRTIGGPGRNLATKMAGWLASRQASNGGWVEADGLEYPESDGEALRALGATIGANVTINGFKADGVGGSAWRAGAQGAAKPFDQQ